MPTSTDYFALQRRSVTCLSQKTIAIFTSSSYLLNQLLEAIRTLNCLICESGKKYSIFLYVQYIVLNCISLCDLFSCIELLTAKTHLKEYRNFPFKHFLILSPLQLDYSIGLHFHRACRFIYFHQTSVT